MIDFDRIGEVLSSRANGIVPVRFFCSCRALLNHARVSKSAFSSMSGWDRNRVISTWFALGLSVETSFVVPHLTPSWQFSQLSSGIEYALEHPNASLRHFLEGSVSADIRMYADAICEGFSLGHYDIPEDLFSVLMENCSDSVCHSPQFLYRLIVRRHLERATQLLQEIAQTAHAESGFTVMHMFARDGDVTALRWGIGSGYNVDIIDNNGWTPLSSAVYGGHYSATSYLLDKGVRTKLIDTAGNSLLHLACMSGSLEVVEHLSKKEFDKVGCCDIDGQNCLHISAKNGHWKLVEWCLENGFDPNQLDSNGLSALHHAASADSSLSVSALHSRGATYLTSTVLESPLLVAVRNRRIDVLHMLIDLYGLESELSSAFQLAFSLGFSEIVEALLRHCNMFNVLWDGPKHVLSVAISSNNPILVRMLLRRPDIDISEDLLLEEFGLLLTRVQWEIANDIIGGYKLREFAMDKFVSLVESSKLCLDSFVEVAMMNCYVPLLELTLDAGLDVNVCLEENNSLLTRAAEAGLYRMIELLIRRGAKADAMDRMQLSPLMYASMNGHSSCVNLLLKSGANVDADDSDGMTSLMMACQNGHSSCVELLLRWGANVNAAANDQMTPLMHAVRNGHSTCVETLVIGGADVNACRNEGTTALMYAALNSSLSIVELLLRHGADVNAKRNDGMTSLMHASHSGQSSCVELLLRHGADVNAASYDGMTALMFASERGNFSSMEILLSCGAEVNAATYDGTTSLMLASERGKDSSIEVLLSHGANVNAARNDGMTSLILSAQMDNPSCMQLLMSHGADVNASRKDGWTPLMIATMNGYSSCVELLRQFGALGSYED